MRKSSFWIALALGAIGGGIAALLYAPRSGAATRRKLRRNMEDGFQEAGDYLKEQTERLGKEAQKLIEASRNQWGGAVDTATGYMKTANKAAKVAKMATRLM
jgi:gas vesicle protein